MFLSYLILFIALSLSVIAAWYSIIGLTAIFAAAVIPIIIMGGALEVAKVAITVWLHQYWRLCRPIMKAYLVPAVFFLMLLTSMGIFGFLSKAHLDQAIPSGDVQAKLSLVDEKIKTQRDNIAAARKALQQMDEAVDQTMARSSDEKGADKAAALRRNQARERGTLQADIGRAQAEIAKLNEVRAPIASEVRKVEAEVGPIKYIAALIYGDNPDANLLEKAVRWVIIIIVAVFDPLAIMMVLAATESMQWHRSGLVARLRNEPIPQPDPENNHKEQGYERKLIDFVDGMAQSGRGLVQRVQSRFQRKEPVPQPVPQTAEPATAEPPALGPAEPVQPNDQPMVPDSSIPQPLPAQVLDPTKVDESPVIDDITQDEDTQESVPTVIQKFMQSQSSRNNDIDLDAEYIDYQGKLWRREALMSMHPELWNSKIKIKEDTNDDPANVRFGVEWPKFAEKGDQFLRVDYLPTKLFKYNGNQWIEIDKNTTDTYSYDKNYIEYLIEKIASGEYDPELLSDSERAQLQNILARDITLKK
jgi:hypothetical protein